MVEAVNTVNTVETQKLDVFKLFDALRSLLPLLRALCVATQFVSHQLSAVRKLTGRRDL